MQRFLYFPICITYNEPVGSWKGASLINMSQNSKHHAIEAGSFEQKLQHVRDRVIHSIAKNIDLYGIPPSIGRLYGTMYFHNEPMTLDEMRDALGMSKSSMSTGVRSLVDIKMVHRTWQKGVRKDLYEPEEDWYKTFVGLFSTKWGAGVEYNKREIEKAMQELQQLLVDTDNPVEQSVLEQDIDKLKHALQYYDWLLRLVRSFETGEIFDLIPKSTDSDPSSS